jgi:hypothetical protein
LPWAALALLHAAWMLSFTGRHRADQLDVSQFGPCEEVYEAFARDQYVAGFQRPYFAAAVLFDCLAVTALFAAGAARQLGVTGILVALLCLPSIAWHMVGLLVTMMFAA